MSNLSSDMIQPPLVLSAADDIEWDDDSDVVVLGFGGAGAVAALEAREAGADVLVIDRFNGGGATAFSGGILYAGGTRHQRASGFNDTPENMYNYLSQEVTAVKPETLRRFCEGSNGDVEWLEKWGVEYGDNAYLQKVIFPPDGHWLYYSGNENTPKFKEKADAAPRGHRPVTPGLGGHLYYAKLREATLASGARFLPHAPARRLITDQAGAVLGVEVNALPDSMWPVHDKFYSVVSPWRPFNNARAEKAIVRCRSLEMSIDRPRRIRARNGVIIATGGFIYNVDMLKLHRELVGRIFTGLLRIGSMGCDGSGIALGQSVGGATDRMDQIYMGRQISPPEAFVSGLMVNARGERFINEDAYQSLFGDRLAEMPEDGRALLVLDAISFWKGIKQSFFPGRGMFMMWGAPALMNVFLGGTRRARTLSGLARKCRIDETGLLKTVDAYNQQISHGLEDGFGKAKDKMIPMSSGPYYAVNVSLNNKFGPPLSFTLGGLRPNEETGEVLSEAGTEIKGLYVAGRAGVGLCSSGYMSGLSIADTVFSGRRAGRHAAGIVD